MRTRVKVCGLTCPADALAATAAGTDAVGLVFAASPRQVSAERAMEITAALPPFVSTVGVFVNADPDAVVETARQARLTAVQLHGDETPAQAREVRARGAVLVIKALRVRDASVLETLAAYQGACDAILLDAYHPAAAGGTGHRFDWQLARAARDCGLPLILAGGLTPANVTAAIREARPYAVDVSSGVEAAPGRKDTRLLRAFLAAVRAANETCSATGNTEEEKGRML